MQSTKTLLPEKFELVLYATIAVAIMALGNFDFFTDQSGVSQYVGTHTINEITSIHVKQALTIIDGLSISATGSVFVFWSFIGILTLSIIHSVYGVYKEVSDDVRVATSFYHPSHFSTRKFWAGVGVQALLNFGLYIVVLFVGFFVATVLTPVAIIALRELITDFSVLDVGMLVIATLTLWLGLLILGVGLRLILLRKDIAV